jgi:outer membrane beta-barrel protein
MKRVLMAAVLLVIGFTTVAASAQPKNPLDGQPAVRKRTLHLPWRFELEVETGFSFLQDFKHYYFIGLKAEYHLIEQLSLGVFFDYAVVNWNTGLTNEIQRTLPESITSQDTRVDPSPSRGTMFRALDTMQFQAGAFLAYTPWFGKLALFGKLFGKFDLSILAGAGFVYLKAGTLRQGCAADGGEIDPTGTCGRGVLFAYQDEKNGGKNGGLRIGPLLGFGLRFFLLKWLALNFNFRAVIVKRNQAGFDRTGDTRTSGTDTQTDHVLLVNKKDDSWEGVMSFMLGVSFFLPAKAPTSR